MRVKVKGGTYVRLESGRPFSAARDCTPDLDALGYSEAQQKELLEHPGISSLSEAAASANATDPARELAVEHEIDLSGIDGSGAEGRILLDDVRAAITGTGS